MGNWLFDIQASQLAGRNIFRLPYPGGNWLEEKKNNEEFLFLMDIAKQVATVGYKQKKGKKLTDNENKLLEKIAAAL